MSDLFAERSRIDSPDHLAHDARELVAHGDLRVEARGRRRRGCGTDDDRGEREEIVRLDDHCEAAPVLSMTAPARKLDRVNITANHEVAP